ncbi:MAG: SMC-Scp complex subunit ScpB, partial [Leptospiraceae bacterium]|nr:SMC-Scp complex subunit ScpB [Leptospiraceae bacterium]
MADTTDESEEMDDPAAGSTTSDPETVSVKVADAKDAGLPEHRELDNEESDFFRGLIEAILFLADQPQSLNALARKCELDRVNTRVLVDSLVDDYAERDGGVVIREIAGGYQFVTAERYSEAMKLLFKNQKRETLSR